MQKTFGLFFCIIFIIVFTPFPFGESVIVGGDGILEKNLPDFKPDQASQPSDVVGFSNNKGVEVAFVSPMDGEVPQDLGNGSMKGRADNVEIQTAVHDQSTKTSTNDNPANNPTSPRIEPGTLFLFGIGLAGLAVVRLIKF